MLRIFLFMMLLISAGCSSSKIAEKTGSHDTATVDAQVIDPSQADLIGKAESGHLASQYKLAQYYMLNTDESGNPVEIEKTLYWLGKIADNENSPEMQHMLGEGYHYGSGGVKRDFEKAADWYKKAAQNGSAAAMDYLGIFHARGLGGLEKSCKKAVNWYELALASGFLQSENNIAYTYATCSEDSFRDGEKALIIATKVVNADQERDPGYLDTLAAAYAEVGDFKNAVKFQKEALSKVNIEESEKRYQNMLKKVEMYKKGIPARGPESAKPEDYGGF